jgi:hypothetical protein
VRNCDSSTSTQASRFARVFGGDLRSQIGARMKMARLALDADARVDAAALARVELRGVQQRAHAAFFVVVTGLQQRGDFPRSSSSSRSTALPCARTNNDQNKVTMPTTAPHMQDASVAATSARKTQGDEIGARSGAMAPMPEIWIPTLDRLAKAADRVQRDQLAVLGQGVGWQILQSQVAMNSLSTVLMPSSVPTSVASFQGTPMSQAMGRKNPAGHALHRQRCAANRDEADDAVEQRHQRDGHDEDGDDVEPDVEPSEVPRVMASIEPS